MNFRKLPYLLVPIIFLSTSIQAQQRECDMAITLTSPAEAQVIGAFLTFNVTVNITNNGPDDLMVGDTVYYNTPSMFAFDVEPFVLAQGIPSGSSASVTLTSVQNINENNQDETTDYCVKVLSHPNDIGSFIDTTGGAMNNTDCNTITLKASNPSAIDELQQDRKLQIYPNPAAEKVTLKLTGDLKGEAFVTIRDVSGRIIAHKDLGKINSGTADLQINVADLLPGIYLLELHNEGSKAIGKLVKQ